MINESRMTDYIQSEVALAETQSFKIIGWLLHWVHYGFNVCITASFALNKLVNVPCQVQIVPAQSCVTLPSWLWCHNYERRENELSNDVYIFEKNNSELLSNVPEILGFLFFRDTL